MLANSLLVQALRGTRGPRPPVWFMRQAGRALPEYRELRAKHEMLEVIRTPKLAAEVTLQPLRRFELDAGIIFADILNPLIGMGVDLTFEEGRGPVIRNPVQEGADVERLQVPKPVDNVAYTLEAIERVTAELTPQGTPLLGFAGAPFTLSAYLIEGSTSTKLMRTKLFMWEKKDAWQCLQEKLVAVVSDYLVAQVEAGASAVQLFDSWVGVLSPADYEHFVYPYVHDIVAQVSTRVDAPLLYFSTGSAGLYERMSELPVQAFGIDWRMGLRQAGEIFQGRPLQGNLDPQLLCGPWERVAAEARRVLAEGQHLPAHIFNLGHGILPQAKLENIGKLVQLVRGEG